MGPLRLDVAMRDAPHAGLAAAISLVTAARLAVSFLGATSTGAGEKTMKTLLGIVAVVAIAAAPTVASAAAKAKVAHVHHRHHHHHHAQKKVAKVQYSSPMEHVLSDMFK